MTPKSPEPAKESPPPASSAPATDPAAQPTGSDSAPPGAAAPTAAAPAGPSAVQPTSTGATPSAVPASAGAPATGPAPVRAATTTRRGGGAGPATVLALMSLVVAVSGIGIGLYALDVAREAKSAAAPTLGPYPAPIAPTTPTAQASPSTTPAAITGPTQRPVFLAEIVTAQVSVPAADGCAPVYVDVDTLAVGRAAGHELYLSSCLGPQTLRIDRKDSAAPITANPTPEACAAQLAGTQAAPELALQVRQGLTFCLVTAREDAADQGIPQRLAIVTVRSIGLDRSVTLEVSTFRVQLTREPSPSA